MFRNIIHIHIPAFPIALARVERPALKGRPVAVVPHRSVRAPILFASSEARRESVFRGIPLAQAMHRCPGLTVLPPDSALMEKAERELSKIVSFYTPLWEPSRPGHIYLDLSGTERLWGRAKDTALRLRREIRNRLCLSGTAGVAGNKMISSIASRIVSPETILDVAHGRESIFMAPLSVHMVPGIGRFRRHILLEELHITRVRDLAAMDMPNLVILFGRQAAVIHQRSLGIDPTPVYPSAGEPVVSEEITLPEDENDDRKLMDALFTLVEKGAQRLRKMACLPRKVGLLICYADHVKTSRQCRLNHPCFLDFELYDPMKELFFKACTRRVRIRFIRVWFRDFSRPSLQMSLFDIPSPGPGKKAGLLQALDRIRERHGQEAIRYARAA